MRNVSIRIVGQDDPTMVLPADQEGHVAIAAPSMLSRYLDEETPLAGGHFLTGDLGRLDERGRLHITGRLKLLMDVGGLKVNPLEIESVLLRHPRLSACAVVPMALSDTVTRPRALVVPRPGADPPSVEELRCFLKEHLSPYKVPRVIEQVQSLPRSPSGKLLRHLIPSATC